MIVTKARSPQRPRAYLAVISGGPGGPIFPHYGADHSSRYWLRLAGQGIVVIQPGYLGTSTRTVYPNVDGDHADKELAFVLDTLRTAAKGTPVCVLGMSLGGYLAARLSRQYPEVPTLAVNPLITTPAAVDRIGISRNKGEVRWWYQTRRQHKLENGKAVFHRNLPITIPEYFRAFFGSRFNQSLADILRGAPASDLTILYSREDDRIGADQAPKIAAAAPHVRMIALRSGGHVIGEARNFWRYRPEIDRFVERCVKTGELRRASRKQ